MQPSSGSAEFARPGHCDAGVEQEVLVCVRFSLTPSIAIVSADLDAVNVLPSAARHPFSALSSILAGATAVPIT